MAARSALLLSLHPNRAILYDAVFAAALDAADAVDDDGDANALTMDFLIQ